MDKDYAELVDEALFECDLDLELSAKVVEVNIGDTGALCTIQCANMPNDAQLKLFLDEIRTEVGEEFESTVVDIDPGQFAIKIGKKNCNN
jgi:hypothetical protein